MFFTPINQNSDINGALKNRAVRLDPVGKLDWVAEKWWPDFETILVISKHLGQKIPQKVSKLRLDLRYKFSKFPKSAKIKARFTL